MALEDLQKKIYKPGSDFGERAKSSREFQIERERKRRIAEEWQIAEKKKMPPKKKKKIVIFTALFITIFIALAGWLIWRGFNSFNSSGVSLTISGPERTVSGDEVVYTVDYENDTRLGLADLKLVVYYPEGSIPANDEGLAQSFDLPDLEAGQKSKLKIPVRIIGLKNDKKEIRVEMNYQPATIMSRFISKADFSTTIISVPLVLNFDLPERLVTGQSFDFSLNYLNQAEIDFDDMRIEMEYPNGFIFESSAPEPVEGNNVWSLGHLMAGQQGKIVIQGSVTGRKNDSKGFKAELGFLKDEKLITYAETVSSLQITGSPLFVSQTINDSSGYIAQAGEWLNYSIIYKNTTDVGIQNVTIISKLEGQALNMSEMKLDSGSFDGSTKTITWNAGNFSDLSYIAPQEEGEVTFSVKLKNSLPVSSLADKNFTVINTVDIDSSQVPLALKDIDIAGQSRLETKIASQMSLNSLGYYYDDTFNNSGPVPPQVGQTTTYTLKWQLTNAGSDLENVKVSALLPPHVKWQSKISPGDAGLSYNAGTGTLIWEVGSLPASTGILLPVRQVVFHVAITPGQAHLNSLVELIGRSTATGKDTFVQMNLTHYQDAIDTDLPDDQRISSSDGVVLE